MKIRLTTTVWVEPIVKHKLFEGKVLDVVRQEDGLLTKYVVRSDAGLLVGVREDQCVVVERDTDREQEKFRLALAEWLTKSALVLPAGDWDHCPICGEYAGGMGDHPGQCQRVDPPA